MNLECLNCRNNFESKVYYQRFCSKDCRESYWLLETRASRNIKNNLQQAKEIYLKSSSYEQAFQKLTEKDADYLHEAMSFLATLYPDRTIESLFEIIKLNLRK